MHSIQVHAVLPASDTCLRVSRKQNSLRLISIDMYCVEEVEACVFEACIAHCLLRLRLNARGHIPDWRNFTNLRCLGFNYSTPSADQLEHILSCCPRIDHLDLSLGRRAPAAVPERGGVDAWTDDALIGLVQAHRLSLTALYMIGCRHITAAGINYALEIGAQLRTITWTSLTGIKPEHICNIATLATRYTGHESLWREMHQHCTSLQQVYILVRSVTLSRLVEDLQDLPALRSVCVVDEYCVHNRKKVLAELQAGLKRQLLRVVTSTEQKLWYNWLTLPID